MRNKNCFPLAVLLLIPARTPGDRSVLRGIRAHSPRGEGRTARLAQRNGDLAANHTASNR